MADRSSQQQDSLSELKARPDEPAQSAAGDSQELCSQKLSWDALLPHARMRLERRKKEFGGSRHVDWSTRLGDSSSASRADIGSARGSILREMANDAGDSQVLPGHASVTEQAKQLALAAREGERQSKRNQRTASRLAVLGSGMAHMLLLVALALVGLANPKPLAGLSFQSVSSEEEQQSVEVTQALDVAAPEEAMATTPSENTIDFSEQLESAVPLVDALGTQPSMSQKLTQAGSISGSPSSSIAKAASFFGAAAGGNNFCYVIDASGSMRGGPWEAARRELLKSLSSLSASQRFYIVMYTRDVLAIPLPGEREAAPYHLYATPENLEHASRWLLNLRIGGSGASPKEALEFAISKEPDAIYLLTDGVTSVKDVAEFIRNKNRVRDLIHGDQIRAPIHTIAFYTLKGQQLLRQLASENGGQFIYVPDPGSSR